MIIIGVIGIFLVIILYVFLYLYFSRRADKFLETWKKELKEKINQVAQEEIKPLQEAAQAIKASREAMEKFAFEKGFITKPPQEEISSTASIIESQAESVASPEPFYRFAGYENHKHKEWENWIPSAELALSFY
jgi:DNA-binding protein H-NS